MKYKHLNIVFFFSLFFNSNFATAQSQTKEENLHNTYAIVIGISGYKDPAIPRLSYADKDATLFAGWLQTKAGGSVPQYDIKLLTNEKATVSAFYEALDWTRKVAKENDVVYIYFSGHGDVETSNKISDGFLLAWNSPPNNYLNNAISVSDLNNTAEELTTKNKVKIVLITDACHSGKMAGDFYKGRQLTAANLQLVLNNQVRMASCKENEEAAEGLGWGGGRGVFSYYLLKGLQGAAEKNDLVKLENLNHFLDSCFASDIELKLSKHDQHPVTNGSPQFTLAQIDSTTKVHLEKGENTQKSTPSVSGLQSLRSVGPQPIDYFFKLAAEPGFESKFSFHEFENDTSDSLLSNITDSFTVQYKNYGYDDTKETIAKLQILGDQLKKNGFIRQRFAERFVQLVHNKSQEMINAYLKGDFAELEKRQYYATHNRNYRDFLSLMKIAIRLCPESNYLKNILQVNEFYLQGLIDRLDITTHAQQADSLLNSAYAKIGNAIRLEPYAAYIHNELGNIYFQKKMYDSALYHFNVASLLSPSWAIPFSNIIRVNLATNHLPLAIAAANTADSLQPNLAFVNTNAGLVMEKAGDLLGAESFYLRAIEENNFHYLPFERLGIVYINAGNYTLADSLLFEAHRRKDNFSLDEEVFHFGIEQGEKDDLANPKSSLLNCNLNADTALKNYKKYSDLIEVIEVLNSPADTIAQLGVMKTKKLLQEYPQIILANHYLGTKLYFNKNYTEAIPYFQNAIASYKKENTFRHFLAIEFTGITKIETSSQKKLLQKTETSCTYSILIFLQYDEREDHYLLGSIYEKNGDKEKALKEYQLLSTIENRMQNEQAATLGYYQTIKNAKDNQEGFNQYLEKNNLTKDQFLAKYNIPVLMGGTLKAAQILENERRYKEAETLLLSQVKQNQAAGFTRQKKVDEYNSRQPYPDSVNEYWLQINEALESETFHFYERMIKVFPRDTYWYKNAGLFLYQRLWLTYKQVAPPEREAFYEYSKIQAYPYKSGSQGSNKIRTASGPETGIKRFYLPGTGEELVIDTSTYDPLVKASYFLQQANKFSGSLLPDVSLIEHIADLESWMGNYDSSITNYQYCVNLLPQNTALRNKLITALRINKQLLLVAQNLDFLQKNNDLNTRQKSELTGYFILQKKFSAATALLPLLPEKSYKEKADKFFLYSQLNMLQGNYNQELSFIKSHIPDIDPEDENLPAILYTKARAEALSNKNIDALKTLRGLLSTGFHLYYVLAQDHAWDALRKTEEWKKLLQEFPFRNMYEIQENGILRINYQVVDKRIPSKK